MSQRPYCQHELSPNSFKRLLKVLTLKAIVLCNYRVKHGTLLPVKGYGESWSSPLRNRYPSQTGHQSTVTLKHLKNKWLLYFYTNNLCVWMFLLCWRTTVYICKLWSANILRWGNTNFTINIAISLAFYKQSVAAPALASTKAKTRSWVWLILFNRNFKGSRSSAATRFMNIPLSKKLNQIKVVFIFIENVSLLNNLFIGSVALLWLVWACSGVTSELQHVLLALVFIIIHK